ncbi:hypothetical protein ANTQUA_LOCUS7739 [Anthophora quadrimaculata]
MNDNSPTLRRYCDKDNGINEANKIEKCVNYTVVYIRLSADKRRVNLLSEHSWGHAWLNVNAAFYFTRAVNCTIVRTINMGQILRGIEEWSDDCCGFEFSARGPRIADFQSLSTQANFDRV